MDDLYHAEMPDSDLNRRVRLSHNQILFNQIKILVQEMVNKKVMRSSKHELLNYVNSIGWEGEKFLLFCLLESLDLKNPTSKEKGNQSIRAQFFMTQLAAFTQNPQFQSYFSQILEELTDKPKEYIKDLLAFFKLPFLTQLILGVSFSESYNGNIAQFGQEYLKEKLQEYLKSGKPVPISDHLLHKILTLVHKGPNFQELTQELKFLVESQSGSIHSHDVKCLSQILGIVKPESYSEFQFNKQNLAHLKKLYYYVSPADLMEELLQNSTASAQQFSQIMNEFSPLSEEDIFDCIMVISNNHQVLEDSKQRCVNQIFWSVKNNDWSKFSPDEQNDKRMQSWNIDNFIKSCVDQHNNLKVKNLQQWTNVLKKIDNPNLNFKDKKAFAFFLKFFQRLKKLYNFNFPESVLFGNWKYPASQLQFITNLLNLGQPELLFFNDIPKKLVQMEFNAAYKFNTLNPASLQFWACIDFLELIVDLATSENYATIRQLFEFPIQKSPDLLTLGLAQINPSNPNAGLLINDIYTQLFPIYLINHANSIPLLDALWKLNQSLMISAISEVFRRENSSLNLSRVLDITQEIKDSLLPIVNCNDICFSVALGILAGKRDFLHFDQWINERIKVKGDDFVFQLLSYIDEQIIKQQNVENQAEVILEKAQLSLESLGIIFENLMVNHIDKLNNKNKALLQIIYQKCCSLYPLLEGSTENITVMEVEQQANNYFQKIYRDGMDIQEAIELLTKFKNSNNPTEKEIFACMISNLFDEYRFHNQYPVRELQITGQLFGALINSKLIDGVTLMISLRCVTDALEKYTGKRFEFGIKALEQFMKRVHEWPQICATLFSIESLQDKYPSMLEEIRVQFEKNNQPLEVAPEILAKIKTKLQNKNKVKEHQPTPVQEQKPKKNNFIDYNQEQETKQHYTPAQTKKEERLIKTEEKKKSQEVNQSHQQPQPQPQPQNPPQPQHQPAQTVQPPQIAAPQNPPQHNNLQLQDIPSLQNLSTNASVQSHPVVQEPKPVQPMINLNQTFSNPNPPVNPIQSSYISYNNQKISLEESTIEDSLENLIKDEIRSKVTFYLNQLSSQNMNEFVQDLLNLVNEPNFVRWFSRTLVQKRAALEQMPMQMNYVHLLGKVNKKPLYSNVVKETYLFLRFLLLNKQERQNEKNILKNLGSFLGQMTLARNKPIVLKYLNLKQLISEAFHLNKLEKVIPLVCRILEGIKYSTVFKVANPWVTGILSLLTELSLLDLKLALKCEIQILFKNLDLSLDQFPPSNLIVEQQNSIQEAKAEQLAEQNSKMEKSISQQVADGVFIDQKIMAQFNVDDIQLTKIVATSLENAIKEIISPVISRSVTIAMITTREIGLKDFAYESDENKIKRGINLILQNLAGSLALVTCRDPLKMTLCNLLKEALDQTTLSEKAKESIIYSTSMDNLDFGCQLIKRAVIEKALEDVYQDNQIQETIIKKQRAREKNEFYVDETYKRMFETLPSQLRPNLGSLSQDQLRVYEDFGPTRNDQKSDFQRELDAYKIAVLDKFTLILKQVDLQLDAIENMHVNQGVQEFQQLISKGQDFIKALKNFDELVHDLNHQIYQILFIRNKNSVKKIAYFVELLYFIKMNTTKSSNLQLRTYIEKLPDHILENQEIFQAYIFIKFIKRQIIWINEFDELFSQLLLKKGYPSIQICLIYVIKELVFKDKMMILQNFQLSLESLKKFKSHCKETQQFFEEIKAYANQIGANISKQEIEKENNFQILVKQKFEEWLQITTESQISQYIKNLEHKILLKGSENLQRFFVIIIEISINKALQNWGNNPFMKSQHFNYSEVDSISKLITILLRTILNFDRNELLERIFESFIIVMDKNYEVNNINFQQRPFFRLLFNIIYDMKRPEYSFQNQEIQEIFQVFMKLFHNIQPLKYSGFAFAWLELISNRYFLTTVLQNQEFWLDYHQLLIYLFKFFKQNVDILNQASMQTYFKGTLKLMLVLLHDYPDFLSQYAYAFCEEIPDQFIQIRNIVLAAYPRKQQLQDPFQVTHIDMIEDFKNLPEMNPNFFERKIIGLNLQNDIFSYLYNKNENDYRNICSKFISTGQDGIQQIDVSVVNAFVIAVPWMINVNYSNKVIDRPKFYEIRKESYQLFVKLLRHSMMELRDIILNSIINNIRYPNLITYYFINFVLLVFLEMDNENIQEHITRIIVERLIVEKPHPWGITYTFIELIRDQKFNFKNKGFFRNSAIYEDIIKLVFKSKGTYTQSTYLTIDKE